MWKMRGASRNTKAKCYGIAKVMEMEIEKQKRNVVFMRKSEKAS